MHFPVLQKEILKYLNPKLNENFIDATIGEGGHTTAILEKNKPTGKVLGIEIDQELYKKLKSRMEEFSIFPPASEFARRRSRAGNFQFSNRLVLVNDSYINLKEIVKREKFKEVSGILFDLGLSIWHLKESGRGFSFQRDEPLDMRYRTKCQMSNVKCQNYLTAEKIVNEYSLGEIEKIFKEYGEERFAKRITKEIIEERKIRPIKTTFQLVELIKRATPNWYHYRKIHFATRTFQALRIAVNDELNNLKKVLPRVLEVLEKRGRLVVISFHSLEDRIVKDFFRENSLKLKVLTKKPIWASREEIKQNPRSRSAKLRAAIKL